MSYYLNSIIIHSVIIYDLAHYSRASLRCKLSLSLPYLLNKQFSRLPRIHERRKTNIPPTRRSEVVRSRALVGASHSVSCMPYVHINLVLFALFPPCLQSSTNSKLGARHLSVRTVPVNAIFRQWYHWIYCVLTITCQQLCPNTFIARQSTLASRYRAEARAMRDCEFGSIASSRITDIVFLVIHIQCRPRTRGLLHTTPNLSASVDVLCIIWYGCEYIQLRRGRDKAYEQR